MRIVKQTLAAHNRVSDGQLVSALLALGCAGATWLISPSMPLWAASVSFVLFFIWLATIDRITGILEPATGPGTLKSTASNKHGALLLAALIAITVIVACL